MALGIALLINLERDNKNKLLIFIILIFNFAEGSIMATAMVLIFYYLKEDKIKMSLAYIAISAVFLQTPMDDGFCIAFILMYNGKRG